MRASRTHRRARTMAPISLVRKYERSNARKCEGGFTYSPRTPQAAVAVPQGDDSSTHRDDDAVTTDSGTYGRSPSREHSEEIAGTEVHDGDGDLLGLPWTTEEDDLLKELKKIEEDFTFEKIASMFCRFAGLPKTSSEYRGEIHKRTAIECAQRWETPVESPEEFESPAERVKKRPRTTRASAGTVAANPVKKKTTPKVTNKKKKETPKATNKEKREMPNWTHPELSLLEKLIRTQAGDMSRKEFVKYASQKISKMYGINRTPCGVDTQLSGRFKPQFQKIKNKDDANEVTDEEESESQLLTDTENEGSLNEPMQQERPPLQSLEHEIRMIRLRHAHDREMAQMLYEQEKEMTELLHKQSLTTH